MYIFSGILNIIAGILFVWFAVGKINDILLLIPAALFFIAGILCIARAVKKK